MCQYLENCRRYVQSYYLWLIGSCICSFDWHQDRWPWMTLNSISLNFREFLRISQISDATTAKRMKIDQYCQRQHCKHIELEQYRRGEWSKLSLIICEWYNFNTNRNRPIPHHLPSSIAITVLAVHFFTMSLNVRLWMMFLLQSGCVPGEKTIS